VFNSIIQCTSTSHADVRGFCPVEVAAVESHFYFPGWDRICDCLDEDFFDFHFFGYDEDVCEADDWKVPGKDFCELWAALQDAFKGDVGIAATQRHSRAEKERRGIARTQREATAPVRSRLWLRRLLHSGR